MTTNVKLQCVRLLAWATVVSAINSPAYGELKFPFHANGTPPHYLPKRHHRLYTQADAENDLRASMDFSGVARPVGPSSSFPQGGFFGWATMINRYCFLTATHVTQWGDAKVGDTVRFYLSNNPNGAYEDRVIVGFGNVPSSDLSVGMLASATTGAVYPIMTSQQVTLPATVTVMGSSSYTEVVVNGTVPHSQSIRIGINTIDSMSSSFFYMTSRTVNNSGTDHCNTSLGDSGGPTFRLDGTTRPPIVGIHSVVNGDVFPGYYTSQITTAIQTLHGNYGYKPGDANRDCMFNTTDISQIFAAGKYETGQAATWEQGDFNGDGYFTSSDMTLAYQQGTYEMPMFSTRNTW
jgi:hypothetical protein